MAKDNKKVEETKKEVSTELSVENVVDTVRSGNLLKAQNVQDALAEIEKEKDEKLKSEAKVLIMTAQYNNVKALLQLRARRREEKITKDTLTRSKTLLDRVLAGELTKTEYGKEKETLEKEMRKLMLESNSTLDSDLRELRNSYEGRYAYWWD